MIEGGGIPLNRTEIHFALQSTIVITHPFLYTQYDVILYACEVFMDIDIGGNR